jgi:hypothetical protein
MLAKIGPVRPFAAVSRPPCSIFDLSIKTPLHACRHNLAGRAVKRCRLCQGLLWRFKGETSRRRKGWASAGPKKHFVKCVPADRLCPTMIDERFSRCAFLLPPATRRQELT